jgi:hypothetical protein
VVLRRLAVSIGQTVARNAHSFCDVAKNHR